MNRDSDTVPRKRTADGEPETRCKIRLYPIRIGDEVFVTDESDWPARLRSLETAKGLVFTDPTSPGHERTPLRATRLIVTGEA
ncbi:MAG: hypothetical protein ACKOCN_12240, partial [Planctomycetaceae bacterium]